MGNETVFSSFILKLKGSCDKECNAGKRVRKKCRKEIVLDEQGELKRGDETKLKARSEASFSAIKN